MTALLADHHMRVFFEGIWSSPRLSHPEGVAVGPDGWIWCGNQDGDICRVAPDGSTIERVASTGGFTLGLAFDGDRALYACDLRHAAVFRLDLARRDLARLTAPGLRVPNYPVVDPARRRLLVSDSHAKGEPGPGIFSFDLATGTGVGAGHLWCDTAFDFANGMALRPGEDALYLCETFARRITRIALNPDGTPGAQSVFARDLPGLPDGIAFDAAGNMIVGCYEPSRLLRISADGSQINLLAEDITAHMLCHPTNIAFAGNRLFTANLGRWHLTEVTMDIGAPALWEASL